MVPLGKLEVVMIRLTRWLVVVMVMVILTGCQAVFRPLPTAELPDSRPFCPGGMCREPEATELKPESPSLQWLESPSLQWLESPSLPPEESPSLRPLESLQPPSRNLLPLESLYPGQ
jgi:hypothetical protein